MAGDVAPLHQRSNFIGQDRPGGRVEALEHFGPGDGLYFPPLLAHGDCLLRQRGDVGSDQRQGQVERFLVLGVQGGIGQAQAGLEHQSASGIS